MTDIISAVLLLGAGKDNMGFLRALKSNYPHIVVATDFNGDAPGKSMADLFVNVSYLDTAVILEEIKNRPVAHVLLGTTAHQAYLPKLDIENRRGMVSEVPAENARCCIDKVMLDRMLGALNLAQLGTCFVVGNHYVNTSDHLRLLKSGGTKNMPVVVVKPGESVPVDENEKMLAQRYIKGRELRVDVFPGHHPFLLEKVEGQVYRNLPDLDGHTPVIDSVLKINRAMKFDRAIVKYDILDNGRPHIIDVGFDYPIRFCGLLADLDIDYIRVLLDYYVKGVDRFEMYAQMVNQSTKCVKGLTVL